MKTHIMRKEPYDSWGEAPVGRVEIYQSLCGIIEPRLQAHGSIVPTCKKCIKLRAKKIDREGRE